jgi:hypothetical protein
MPKLTAKQQYWSEQLLQADAFDGTVAEYAQANNIPVKKLYRWRNYFRKTISAEHKAETVFTQVVSSSMPNSSLKVKLGNTALEFIRLPSPQWLAQLILVSSAP